MALGFSETEIDSLESTGKKVFSPSPWRTEIGFSLSRNLELNSLYISDDGDDIRQKTADSPLEEKKCVGSKLQKLFSPSCDSSLLDFSDLYYGLSLNLYYSPKKIAKSYVKQFSESLYNWLENTEFFIVSSFQSPFTGYRNEERPYDITKYIHYGLNDISAGFITLIYQKSNFLSEFSFSLMPYRISRFSIQAGLNTFVSGGLSLLYFIHKGALWNLAFASSHSTAYRYYTKNSADHSGHVKNTPWNMSHSGSVILRQNRKKYIPNSMRVFLTHYFGINTSKTRNQDLTIGTSSSWRLKNKFYLNLSIRWKDRIHYYNPTNEKIKPKEPPRFFNLSRYAFILGGSYSF